MLLHKLRHINSYKCFLASKHCICKSFWKFSFSNACRSEEKEWTNWPVRVFKANSASSYSSCYWTYCFILTYYPFVKCLFEFHKTLWFCLCNLWYRYFCPWRYYICNFFFSDIKTCTISFFFPVMHKFCKFFFFLCLLFFYFSSFLIGLIFNCLFFFLIKFLNLFFKFLDIIRHYIWKKPVINISFWKFYSSYNCFIINSYIMMFLIFATKTHKNLNCLFFCRFFYFYRLETAFKSSIFFYIFSVFLKSCCTYKLYFTSRKRRF